MKRESRRATSSKEHRATNHLPGLGSNEELIADVDKFTP